MIPVTNREFRRGCYQHAEAYRVMRSNNSGSRKLLLFYAVECGLKAKLLKHYRVDTYDKLPPEAQIGHRLNRGFDLLRVPYRVPATTALDKANTRIEHDQLHEAWRYGKLLELEEQAVAELEKALRWLESEHHG